MRNKSRKRTRVLREASQFPPAAWQEFIEITPKF